MPQRLIPIIDAIFFSAISLVMVFASINIISIIVGLLTGVYWVGKIKRDIEKYHEGSIRSWLKWIVKKN